MQSLRILLVAAATFAASSAFAAVANILVSGQTAMLIVDGNNDGPGPGDCVFTATVNPPSFTATSFASTATQDTTTPVYGCGGTASGTMTIGQDTSSDFVFTAINSASNPAPSSFPWPFTGLFHAPVFVDAFEEFADSPNGLPIAINTIEIESSGRLDPLATLALCQSAGAPAVRISGSLGSIVITTSLYPNPQSPTHVKIPNIPLLKVGGGVAFLDAYIPISNRAITVSFDDNPSSLLVDLPIAALPPCGNTAPSLSPLGLSIAAGGLLVLGALQVHLRRRRRGHN